MNIISRIGTNDISYTPRTDPDFYNKTLLCLFIHQAVPHKVGQVDIREVYNDGSDNYIVPDKTGVIRC